MDMTQIISAAAVAAGTAPEDPQGYQAWRGRTLSIANDLAGMVTGYESREARKRGEDLPEGEKVTKFHATLVKVDTLTRSSDKGSVIKGVLHLKAHASNNTNEQGFEEITTAPLGTPEGDEEMTRASALVGQDVIIYKRNFLHPDDKSKKLKELVAIDRATTFTPVITKPAATGNRHPSQRREPEVGDPFAEQRAELREVLGGMNDQEKSEFRVWLSANRMSDKSGTWTADDMAAVEGWLAT